MIKKLRIEGDFIKLNEWLTPLSWIYGAAVTLRNWLFDIGVKKSRSFSIPVISVGNITVGGSGKTPHVEYLVNLLHDNMKVAVLSRGYKRRSRGYRLAGEDSTVAEIGDEAMQMHLRHPDVYVAVDKKRVDGIYHLTHDKQTKDVDVILLDDAFQHRYVRPGINILLTDYHRLIIYDRLLPVGRLREPVKGKSRADMVIVTKCPADLKPMEFRVLTKALNLYPYQELFFSTFDYKALVPLFPDCKQPERSISADDNVLLLTGIASPRQMILDLKLDSHRLRSLSYPDHHNFSEDDVAEINNKFHLMPSPKLIITTEKDSVRLLNLDGLSQEVRENIYVQPIKVRFMQPEQEQTFNDKIISYVRKNSRNSILAKTESSHKS